MCLCVFVFVCVCVCVCVQLVCDHSEWFLDISAVSGEAAGRLFEGWGVQKTTKNYHKGVAVLPTPDGVLHRGSHYWRKCIGVGTQDTNFFFL